MRGLHWGESSNQVLLVHELGTDVDAWGTLPAFITQSLPVAAVTIDLPGHGLSDDPWEPDRIDELVPHLFLSRLPPPDMRFIIAAGDSAPSCLAVASALQLAGLVCLSATIPHHPGQAAPPLLRSPRVPKLLAAGSLAKGDLAEARRLASASGGWAVVTSIPVAERGSALLTSEWGGRLAESIVAFLRDCLSRSSRGGRPDGPAAKRPKID